LQDQQQGEQILLDWFQIASGCGRWANPISGVLTSASLNDTQAAVPLSLLTAQRVTSLYDLMDAGYDATKFANRA